MLQLKLPIVETKRLILRPICIEDAKAMYEYASDDETIRFLSFPKHQTVEDSAYAIEHFFLSRVERGIPEAYAIVLKENGKMIGTCDIHTINYNVIGEIGYVLNRQYWNQGYMSEALVKLVEVAFDFVGLRRLDIMHSVHNIGSANVIKKAGFIQEGVFREYLPDKSGQYSDHVFYGLLKSDYERRLKK